LREIISHSDIDVKTESRRNRAHFSAEMCKNRGTELTAGLSQAGMGYRSGAERVTQPGKKGPFAW
jgi:hypothetical protein